MVAALHPSIATGHNNNNNNNKKNQPKPVSSDEYDEMLERGAKISEMDGRERKREGRETFSSTAGCT